MMDANQEKAYLAELAHKIKKGTITPEEMAYFDAWYEQQRQGVLHIDSTFAKNRTVLKKRMLKGIEKQIAKEQPRTPIQRLWKPIAAVAALILATLLFTHIFQQFRQRQEAADIAAIQPGSNSATLTLADGTQINLSESADGTVAQANGVRILKTADGQLIYEADGAATGSRNEYHTVEAPVGGKWLVILPDKSKAWLNASSRISYPTAFSGGQREVKIEGEVFFDVTPDKHAPFIVQSKGQQIRVLGTQFNVEAYPEERDVKTTLIEGSVAIQAGKKPMLLVPGEQAVVNEQGITKSVVDTEAAIAWKDGYFKFNENIESILTKIARWYDVDIVYTAKPDVQSTFSGKISRSRDIGSLLKMLEYDSNLHFKIEGRRIIVSK
ncbi:FecR family protein [Sphingobacterium psychroaquaticum]|uniref:FecR family protein n=1 Tax=Sphingobacterium psychroaquaticum TaxID=561061 RepID=UPI00106950DA|nr:FecR domain-containing protein [Sphingobacterium psychroaquaticum]QBQ40618.1 FecR family protein [Sphingobacterium psychroaquaticum]